LPGCFLFTTDLVEHGARLVQARLISSNTALGSYKERHEARPAFREALADPMGTFAAHAPPGT
jgi:hypothetical protein